MSRLQPALAGQSVSHAAGQPARALPTARWLALFSWVVLGFMILVILEGAVVRATGSGAGCGNHWPLCNGQVIPLHPRLATIIEFAHRSLTGILSGMVALLVFGTFRLYPARSRARRDALMVVVFLITEALLGAVLVKGGYVESNASNARVIVQCIHFTNTMLLVAALTLTAFSLTASIREVSPSTPRSRGLVVAALLSTLLAGATGSVAALADTLFPSPSLRAGLLQDFAPTAPLLIRMRWVHPAAAILMTLCALALAWKHRNRATRVLTGLLAVQLIFGVADVLLLAPLWLQVLHLLGADLFWITLVILAGQVFTPRTVTEPATLSAT